MFTIGNASADNKDVRDILSKKELFASLEIDVPDHYAVMTYHPVTLADGEVQEDINELLAALEKFSNLTFIATKANADAGGRGIDEVTMSNMPLSITISFFLTRLDQKGTCLHWPMLMRWSGTLRAA